ncbi:MAG: MFS transporter [Rhodospirillales bacterium CG15_BIG_FIL_POST_REV_8_21_14_020_66_15]|nr:MAG: MFS transporter [Rhodospirillales bacterium CG15_BIG_FIL_POST_REV_8_21_14_020_66_15]
MEHDVLAPRAAALDLLRGVLRRRQALDRQMAQSGFAALDARDRAFAHNLAATALRRLGQIDALISACLDRPLPANAAAAMDILRLGAAQLLFTGTADHAAVDTAVDLARARGQAHLAKLVNAVLRRLQREGADALTGQDAARLNTPDWLWDSWRAAYGDAACRAVAESHLSPAPLDLTVRADAPAWADRLGGRALSARTVRLSGGGPVPDLPGYDEGAWWVQDLAAALPASLLGDVDGKAVLDLCAAPGGKTAQLAAAGARVTAVDRAEKRLEVLRRNLARLNLAAATVTADALDWTPDAPFDAVLLDAPCSATGTIRRHPDLPRLKGPADVARLSALQDRLLARAAGWLRPGGLMVFATCSLQPEEGPERVRAFLAARGDFRAETVVPGESGVTAEMVSGDGWLRTLPSMAAESGGMDGFFAAALRRIA